MYIACVFFDFQEINVRICHGVDFKRPLDATLMTTKGAGVFWTVLNPTLKEVETRDCFWGEFCAFVI
jgi:hypothetical protein